MKFLIFVSLIVFSGFSKAQLVERVQAQVGSKMISFIDLKNFQKQLRVGFISNSLLLKYGFKKSQLLNNRKKLLDFMISREMLFQLAKKESLPPIPREAIEKSLKQKKGSLSHKQFSAKLQRAGLSLKDLRQEILIDLTLDSFITQFVVSKITVSEQDVESYYFNKYNRPLFKSFEYEFVSLQFEEKNKPKILKNLEEKGPIELKELALSLGLKHKTLRLREQDLQEGLKKELVKLSVSQLSPIFQLEGNYYVLQLKWKYPQISLKERQTKARIEKLLYGQKQRAEIKKWVEEKRASFSIVQYSL